jgi:hypothetical protein
VTLDTTDKLCGAVSKQIKSFATPDPFLQRWRIWPEQLKEALKI